MLLKKHFRHYYLKYALYFILGVLLLVTIDWFQLEIPKTVKLLIDGVDEGTINHISQALQPLIYITTITVGMTIGRFLWRWLLFGAGRKIETDIRRDMFIHATTLDQAFYSSQKVGGLMSYFVNDLNAVRELFGFGLLMLVDGLTLGTFVLIRMFSLDWVMTLYAFIPIALMAVLVYFLELRMEQKFKTRQEAFQAMSDFIQESFSGIAVIKAYVKEAVEALRFDSKSKQVQDKSMEHIRYAVMVNIIVDTVITLVILSIVAYSAFLIAKGNLTGGEMTEYIGYFFTLLWPVFAISWFLNINGQAQASATRIYDFLESKPLIIEDKSLIDQVTLDGSISAKNLSFTYPDGSDPVLKDVSFTINNGELVGILGRTGSGKSTLVELLLRVYTPNNDMLYFGPYDTSTLTARIVREHIGYVPQDNFLYSDTIRNNIGFAYTNIDDATLIKAATISDVHENITSFKDQYETVLGERGVTISGGQKQRVSIARALAKDPTILILDDSVSAVDTKTEEAIISNLRKTRKNKTTIMIAHRISTVKKADKIILLDQGMVIGVGNHQQLMKSNKVYQQMVKLQELESLLEEHQDA